MTTITFLKRDGIYYGFRETGHAGFAAAGDDIVCSAISAMTMLVVNAIEVSYASKVDYTIDEESSDITVIAKAALPEFEEDEVKRFAVSGIIYAYLVQLTDMLEEYYEYIDVKETEDFNLQ